MFYNIVPGPIRQWLVLIAICKNISFYVFYNLIHVWLCVKNIFFVTPLQIWERVSDDRKKDIVLTLNVNALVCGHYYKTFLGVIYTISDVFTYDFDWGYANSNVIMLKMFL